MDIAVVNLQNNTVSVLINTGSGKFAPKIDYNAGPGPKRISIGDMNGDGKLDLAIANDQNTISVLINAGSGVFSTKVDYNVGLYPSDISIKDLNGDNWPDIVVANLGDMTISVLTNTGSGVFDTQKVYSAYSIPDELAVADMDGDGKPDIMTVSRENRKLILLKNIGNGLFQYQTYYSVFSSTPSHFAIGDINVDGRQDVIFPYLNDNVEEAPGLNIVYSMTNMGGGSFVTAPYRASPFNANETPVTEVFNMAIGDVNSDGRQDIVATQSSFGGTNINKISILMNKLNQPVFSTFRSNWDSGIINEKFPIDGFNLLATTSVGFAGSSALVKDFRVLGDLSASYNGTIIEVQIPLGAITGPITLSGKGGVAITTTFTIITTRARIGNEDLSKESLTLYPNPAQEIVQISNASISEVMVYNPLGILILKTKTSNGAFDVSFLNQGLYIIHLVNTDGIVTTKKLRVSR